MTIANLISVDVNLAAAITVSTAIAVMILTDTIHPPAGATALIAVIGSEKVQSLEYWYVFSIVLPGVLILYLVYLILIRKKLFSF